MGERDEARNINEGIRESGMVLPRQTGSGALQYS
jgi:hypothetical protein